MTIQGKWHSEGSAAQQEASITRSDDRFELQIEDGKIYQGEISDLHISDRLGNIERKITFDDGSIFATPDNDAIDALFKKSGSISGFIHRIESNMSWVIAGVFVVTLFTFGFYKWVCPGPVTKLPMPCPIKPMS